jgi:hypothetical protein
LNRLLFNWVVVCLFTKRKIVVKTTEVDYL